MTTYIRGKTYDVFKETHDYIFYHSVHKPVIDWVQV